MDRMDRVEVMAQPRQILGKKVRHLRRQGITPASLSGLREPSQALQVDARDLSTLINKQGKNSVVNLRIDGGPPVMALLSDYTVHPIKNTLIHIDFQRIAMGQKLTLDVDLAFAGESPVDKRTDLMVLRILNTIHVESLPQDLPSAIEVDLSRQAEADDTIRVQDLAVPPGITVLTDPDEVIARVTSVQAVEEEAVEAAEAAEETAEEAAEGEAEAGPTAEAETEGGEEA